MRAHLLRRVFRALDLQPDADRGLVVPAAGQEGLAHADRVAAPELLGHGAVTHGGLWSDRLLRSARCPRRPRWRSGRTRCRAPGTRSAVKATCSRSPSAAPAIRRRTLWWCDVPATPTSLWPKSSMHALPAHGGFPPTLVFTMRSRPAGRGEMGLERLERCASKATQLRQVRGRHGRTTSASGSPREVVCMRLLVSACVC